MRLTGTDESMISDAAGEERDDDGVVGAVFLKLVDQGVGFGEGAGPAVEGRGVGGRDGRDQTADRSQELRERIETGFGFAPGIRGLSLMFEMGGGS